MTDDWYVPGAPPVDLGIDTSVFRDEDLERQYKFDSKSPLTNLSDVMKDKGTVEELIEYLRLSGHTHYEIEYDDGYNVVLYTYRFETNEEMARRLKSLYNKRLKEKEERLKLFLKLRAEFDPQYGDLPGMPYV